MKGRKKVRARLAAAAAQEDMALARLDLGFDMDTVDGYVLGVDQEWVLVALFDSAVVLNGHVAVRVEDIRRVERRHNGDFAQQALALRGQWPPVMPDPEPDLDSTRSLVGSLMHEPALTVRADHDTPDLALVGVPVELDERHLGLLEITPRAVWLSKPTKHRLAGLTRVDFGGRYEQALLSVAGPMPLG